MQPWNKTRRENRRYDPRDILLKQGHELLWKFNDASGLDKEDQKRDARRSPIKAHHIFIMKGIDTNHRVIAESQTSDLTNDCTVTANCDGVQMIWLAIVGHWNNVEQRSGVPLRQRTDYRGRIAHGCTVRCGATWCKQEYYSAVLQHTSRLQHTLVQNSIL